MQLLTKALASPACHSSFLILLHAYPRPSKNPPYARSQNCIYHRYTSIYSPL